MMFLSASALLPHQTPIIYTQNTASFVVGLKHSWPLPNASAYCIAMGFAPDNWLA